jgi:hypothetical protein
MLGYMLGLGITLIVVMLALPDGLAGLGTRLRQAARHGAPADREPA